VPLDETFEDIVKRVPGYQGYRDKERRRDSDRLIREQLAVDYGLLADRLGRLATKLADERRIMAIQSIDRPHKRLVSFIDRVRAASYGYAPLFSSASVDDLALDQLAAFDRSLADQLAPLADQIASLEVANAGGAEFKQAASTLAAAIEGLHERFEKRQEVIHAAKPLPYRDVATLFDTQPRTEAPIAFRLHEGEAVSYEGVNYSVVGRISIESSAGSWRAFQLTGGDGDAWIMVSADANTPVFWMRRVDPPTGLGSPSLAIDGAAYTLVDVVEGAGDVFGTGGSATNQPVRLTRYADQAGRGVIHALEWTAGVIALAGEESDPLSLELYSREM
jgi:hypothetical protein